jgi:Nitroreductase
MSNVVTLQKQANAQYPIHDLISQRWSPRAFSDRPVELEKLSSLFEAARWAASAANKQPWSFIYATKENSADFERLAGIMFDNNRIWAQNAPALVLAIAKRGEYAGYEYMTYYDLGMAAGNLVTQAVELGLVTHQMAGFDKGKAHSELHIPEGYDPLTMIAIGYPGDYEDLPEALRERELAERTRQPQEEFVFEGSWK